MRERYDDAGLRQLLRDATLIAERIALCVAADDPIAGLRLRGVHRRRSTAAARSRWTTSSPCATACAAALPSVLAPAEMPAADAAIDEAIRAYEWHRRLAGDARKKNAFLQFLYKGG